MAKDENKKKQTALEDAQRASRLQAGTQIATGVFGAIGSIWQAEALKQQGEWQKEMFEFNAQMARLEAQSTREVGKREAGKFAQKGAKALGAQRASLAAQGIVVDDATALDIQEETRGFIQDDVNMIRNNAYRVANGLEMQAIDYDQQGSFAEITGRSKASQELVGGLLQSTRDFVSAGDTLNKASKAQDEKSEDKSAKKKVGFNTSARKTLIG